MNILLVEPPFPIPVKSKNYAHFLPTGLLKIGSWHRQHGDNVRLVRGYEAIDGFRPERILITSLFTYWSKYVHQTAEYYHALFPKAGVEIGGIYASLMPDHCRKALPYAHVQPGLYRQGTVENVRLDYSLLPEKINYQILHASRGCVRKCTFCGTWRIEPTFRAKATLLPEIQKPKLIFFDNNLLANPNIDKILQELIDYRFSDGKRISWECQSGLDLRLLTAERAALLRASRMSYPRIAWDGGYSQWPFAKRAVNILKQVGYGRKDIFIFMIYNHAVPYEEMRKKLDACRRWRVRVIDCRYRPLSATEDGYIPGPKPQTRKNYYIHSLWSDAQVRGFRRAVRRQNIAILLDLPEGRYLPGCEQRKVSK